MTSQTLDILSVLPPKTWVEILKHLSLQELGVCSQVSKAWNKIIDTNKETWMKLCERDGFVYAVREDELPERCKMFFRFMRLRLKQMKLNRCFDVKPLLEPSLNRPSIEAFHCHGTIVAVATADDHIRIYDLNRSPQLTLVIATSTGFSDEMRIIYQIRTDGTNVVAMTLSGFLSVWNASNGRLVARSDVANGSFCFDLLNSSLLVACGFRGHVKIFSVGSTEVTEVKTSKNKAIMKVMLTRHWSEDKESDPQTLLLFCLDIKHVYVYKVTPTSNPKTESTTKLYVASFANEPENDLPDNMISLNPTLCYDGSNYLYFPHEFVLKRSSIICKLNIRTGEINYIRTGYAVDHLLGAGKRILAFTSTGNLAFPIRGLSPKEPVLHAEDLTTSEKKICCLLSSDTKENNYVLTRSWGGSDLYICEKGWLDGFDGYNDLGPICVYIKDRNTLEIVRWYKRREVLQIPS